MLEGTDRGDLRRLQVLRAGELRQSGDRLVTRVAHHDVGDDVCVLDDLVLHGCLRDDVPSRR